MKKVIIALLAIGISPYAFADKFNGASVSVNGEFSSTTAKVKSDGNTYEGVGRQSGNLDIAADYAFSVNDKFVVLAGGRYALFDNEIAKYKSDDESAKVKSKNHYSLFVAPGYKINQDTLAYVKASFESAKGTLSGTDDDQSRRYNGFAFGVGLRSYITDQVFVNVEASRTFYNKESFSGTSTDTGTTTASFGAGYSF